ncbi:beta-tubulin [Auriculariales sp. MPI-PUGE-AT-0066]|nr:beta-tubulin [Auriculariales sp. MPI-PUGE-AT-0066]
MSCREIISVQVGQAGNQVGEAFWRAVLAEHGLGTDGVYKGPGEIANAAGLSPAEVERQQLNRAGVYFSQIDSSSGGRPKFVPRSVQVDLEQGVVDRVRSSALGSLFRPDTFINGQSGAGNNWGKGYYTEGPEILDQILDVLRGQAERTDALQGFQLIHSLGGGTGGGLGSLILGKLREDFPDRMLATYSILPSPKVSETVVEPYNCLLSIHQLVESSDLTVCLDNEALYDIAVRTLKNEAPNFDDLNNLVAQVMCGTSTSLRFPGQLNGDLRKLAMNLVPFPRLHFLVPSYAPFVAKGSVAFQGTSVAELTQSLFDRKNMLVACEPRFGRYLTAATMFRGPISSREAESAVNQLQTKGSSAFVEWIPDNVSVTLCNVPPVGQRSAAVCLANTTSIQDLFKRTHTQFVAMFKRYAYMHRYTAVGVDEMEFTEAESNTMDLVAEYQRYQDASAGDEAKEEYVEEGRTSRRGKAPRRNNARRLGSETTSSLTCDILRVIVTWIFGQSWIVHTDQFTEVLECTAPLSELAAGALALDAVADILH